MVLSVLGASFIGVLRVASVFDTVSATGREYRESHDGIPNPAAEYCLHHEGVYLVQIDQDGGQRGLCKFADESECLDFPFLRGECRPGECLAWGTTSAFRSTAEIAEEPVCVAKFESLEARARSGREKCTAPSMGTCAGAGDFVNPLLWAFDDVTSSCATFQWNGCVASKYLFLTQQACESVCGQGHHDEKFMSVGRDSGDQWIAVGKVDETGSLKKENEGEPPGAQAGNNDDDDDVDDGASSWILVEDVHAAVTPLYA